MESPDFWDDTEKSQNYMRELKNLKDTIEQFDKLSMQYEDIETLIQMGYEEEDPDIIPEIEKNFEEFKEEFELVEGR